METRKLIAIVEVAQTQRFWCQAPGCGRTAFRRLHVVSIRDAILVVGAGCSQSMLAGNAGRAPLHGTAEGRRLTARECNLLTDNPAAFVAQLERDDEPGYSAPVASRAARVPPVRAQLYRPPASTAQLYGAQARRDVEARYGTRSDLKGWRSLVDLRIRQLADIAASQGDTSITAR